MFIIWIINDKKSLFEYFDKYSYFLLSFHLVEFCLQLILLFIKYVWNVLMEFNSISLILVIRLNIFSSRSIIVTLYLKVILISIIKLLLEFMQFCLIRWNLMFYFIYEFIICFMVFNYSYHHFYGIINMSSHV